jgi:hypothetical protein
VDGPVTRRAGSTPGGRWLSELNFFNNQLELAFDVHTDPEDFFFSLATRP